VSATVRLNDGREMPLLGLGTWQLPDEDASALVRTAIEAGYRLIDTAALYRNERGVGEGVLGAEGVWITTKVWNSDHGADQTRRAVRESLDRLGVGSIDLYLIHWPAPRANRFVETWATLLEMRDEGLLRSIGVSNFNIDHLERIERETGVIPAVNQIELHPGFQQRALAEYHRAKGIVTQSWSPLGQGNLLREPRILHLAEKHRAGAAQVIIAWHIAQGFSAIPKSASPERLRANLGALGLRLDDEDMAVLAAMDDPQGRVGPDPLHFE
jgi:2,5-diketo-D-gluconate reductase A